MLIWQKNCKISIQDIDNYTIKYLNIEYIKVPKIIQVILVTEVKYTKIRNDTMPWINDTKYWNNGTKMNKGMIPSNK